MTKTLLKYIHILSLTLLLLLSSSVVKAQDDGKQIWKTLSHLEFKNEWNEDFKMNMTRAVFTDEMMALNGKEVVVYGYLLPEKGYKTHKDFIISSLPYNLCYFCGKAGPETVMQVTSLDPVRYSEKPITIKGKLMLNVLDPSELPFYLMDAKIVKSK